MTIRNGGDWTEALRGEERMIERVLSAGLMLSLEGVGVGGNHGKMTAEK